VVLESWIGAVESRYVHFDLFQVLQKYRLLFYLCPQVCQSHIILPELLVLLRFDMQRLLFLLWLKHETLSLLFFPWKFFILLNLINRSLFGWYTFRRKSFIWVSKVLDYFSSFRFEYFFHVLYMVLAWSWNGILPIKYGFFSIFCGQKCIFSHVIRFMLSNCIVWCNVNVWLFFDSIWVEQIVNFTRLLCHGGKSFHCGTKKLIGN
jgi:hypothetical protein